MSLLICMFSPPNHGKSVLAARIYTLLARAEVDVEFIQENAKRLVYSPKTWCLEIGGSAYQDQPHKYISQLDIQVLNAALDKHEVIVHDSSPLASSIYERNTDCDVLRDVKQFYAAQTEKGHDVIHIVPFAESGLTHRQGGRFHTAEEVRELKNEFNRVQSEYSEELLFERINISDDDLELGTTLAKLLYPKHISLQKSKYIVGFEKKYEPKGSGKNLRSIEEAFADV